MSSTKGTEQSAFMSDEEAWVGHSSLIMFTKQKLQSMANSDLPVLIQGRTGTGKSIAARTIHNANKGESKPFVMVCCQSWGEEHLLQIMSASWLRAKGGTLFIQNIDLLAQGNRQLIKDFWRRSDVSENRVRLIASCTELRPMAGDPTRPEDHFMDWLYYHCLTIELPNLKDRVDDIASLVAHYQARDLNIAKLSFQPDAWALLKRYAWPSNVKQLKHWLDTLAAQVASPVIDESVLLDCFPALSDREQDSKPGKGQGAESVEQACLSGIAATPESSAIPFFMKQLNQALLYDDHVLSQLNYHPALDKAIVYLYHHYPEPVNMAKLANHACVSSSHLSYLFKRYLGISFKQTLLRLRIVKAMELLTENPNRQVTQVCDDVGFSDLSFFVRKFKATVGLSPGAYRDQYGRLQASPELRQVQDALADTLQRLPK